MSSRRIIVVAREGMVLGEVGDMSAELASGVGMLGDWAMGLSPGLVVG